MLTCPSCRDAIPGDRDQIGARCPRCREPLYEAPHGYPRRSELPDSSAGTRCTAHPGNPALGTCQRCGNFLCAVCRTRWRERSWCMACVERALEAKETSPEEARAHFRQAILAMICGVLAWGLTLAGFLLIALGMSGNDINPVPLIFGFLLLMPTPLPALIGVGQGAAAIRARGDHMILATMGLILSGIHVGVLVGLFTFSVFFNS
jgi:hypothetical protein